jgi:tRNA threonylcarbamoyladenosine biosynthesis protein TsaE
MAGSALPILLLDRVSNSEADTEAIARDLVPFLRPNDLLALDGRMGAGKTRFTRALAVALGVDTRLVSSPTFVLLNIYPLSPPPPHSPPHFPFTNLYHLDAYRTAGSDELESIGFSELSSQGGLILLEWAAQAPELIESHPAGLITIRINPLDETIRHFEIHRLR